MNMHNKLSVIAVSLLGLGLSGIAQAEYVGAASNTTNIQVGQSTVNGGPHVAGKAGVSVASLGAANFVDFAGISAYASTSSTSPTVYTLDYSTAAPTDHSNMGHFNFAKVGSSDIWFGEWSQTSSASDGTHSVYYVGDNTGTTVPTSGTATYAVSGISNFGSNGLLSGTFAADFAAGTLRGAVSNASSGYAVNIGTATIDASTAAFSGSGATATVSGGSVASGGAVSGNFYGAGAASLAGIASFGSSSVYNTAFGGTKN